jgi:hypothetical protein
MIFSYFSTDSDLSKKHGTAVFELKKNKKIKINVRSFEDYDNIAKLLEANDKILKKKLLKEVFRFNKKFNISK